MSTTSSGVRLPPVAELAVASIVMMLAGGILLASRIPGRPDYPLSIALVAVGGAITVVDLVLLLRIRPFAWATFRLVLRWALLAYGVISALLVYVFAINHTPGSTMAVLVVTLVVFAVDVPTILAFTVARFAPPDGAPATPLAEPAP
ncbi:MAG TPA: hypothetical protein VKV25_04225 [Acidimicrobiales bacterium]|nr:hypothetical protein [Acidimicrobiales bacterium]